MRSMNGNATAAQLGRTVGVYDDWVISGNTISVTATGLPYHSYGNPAAQTTPLAQYYRFTLPYRGGTSVPAAVPTPTSYGLIGLWLNGVAMFNPSAANGAPGGYPPPPGGFNYNAAYSEGKSLGYGFGEDLAGGHAAPGGTYHYHDASFLSAWTTGHGAVIGSVTSTGLAEIQTILYLNGGLTHADGHSKILGWAADGYPVYGPYGYGDPIDPTAAVRRMESGWGAKDPSYRIGTTAADLTTWPMGIFVQDFVYYGGRDLDHCNGRICVTPDFPLGTYAYFTTIDFFGKPAFPYVIGDSYYGDPVQLNTAQPAAAAMPTAQVVPEWVTLAQLGSFPENHNFNLDPLIIQFASAPNSMVTILNDTLPPGLRWTRSANTIVINGASRGVTIDTTSDFTFRITNPDGAVSDRTYYITIQAYVQGPSWTGQKGFLGYAALGSTARFTVSATSPTTIPIVYRLIRPPAGMVIDPSNGIITWTPVSPNPIPIGYESTSSFIVRATVGPMLGSRYEELVVTATALSLDHAPAWITGAGELITGQSGEFIETTVVAYDPQGRTVTYALVNPPLDLPFSLTASGFVYGRAPVVMDTATYFLTVSATVDNKVTTRTFNIVITQDEKNGQLTWRTAAIDLGSYYDGQVVSIAVGAKSTRSLAVNHSLVGGSLPPNLTLNTSQGMIAGFIEWHAQPRVYHFEIRANDGYQSITRTYSIGISRSRFNKYLNISIPVMGDVRQALQDTKSIMIDSPGIVPFINTTQDVLTRQMRLVYGLDYQSDNIDRIIESAGKHLHETKLGFGDVGNVLVNGGTFFYRNVVDNNRGAAASQVLGQGLVIYPITLDNMRQDLISSAGFLNAGLGTGCELLPIVNPQTSGLDGAEVVKQGTGYYFSPLISVTGSGNGAVLGSHITVNKATIVEPGYNWTVGQTFTVKIDPTHDISLSVAAVDSNHGLQQLTVADGGSFFLFPQGRRTIIDGNSSAVVELSCGVTNVYVTSTGFGYDRSTTKISATGSEVLPSWQSSYSPYLSIGTVYKQFTSYVSQRDTAATRSILDNTSWPVQHVLATMQGKSWTGTTMLDGDICSFDGGETRFIEWEEPLDTIFDQNHLVLDYNTRFDGNQQFESTAYRIWGTTIFDSETTIYDAYNTIFDEADPSTRSITQVDKIYRLSSNVSVSAP